MEMSRLARDGTAEPVSRDQIRRRERTRTEGNIYFFCQLTTCRVGILLLHVMCDQYESIQRNNRMHTRIHSIRTRLSFKQRYVSTFSYIPSPSGQFDFLHDTFEFSVLFEIKEK